MTKTKWITAIIYVFTSTSAFAQLRGSSNPTTGTTLPPTSAPVSGSGSTDGGTASYGDGTIATTPSTAPSPAPVVQTQQSTATDTSAAGGYAPIVTDTSGIQSAGKSSSGNNKVGMILGIGATAYAGYNAVAACSSESPSCPWWVAGTLAAATVTGYMMSAKKKSDSTVAAVTDPTAGASTGAGSTANNGNGLSTVAYDQDPAWQNAQKSIDQLKAAGWNVNPSNGTATNTKTGQTISASDLSSPASMAAAGYSASDIKAFEGIMDQANAAGKKLAASRGADASGSLFDGVAGGGKSGSTVGSSLLNGSELKAVARQNLGVNRDPAQVAGMSKSYNGEQIGVAQDSLFNMIDRRYQLHDKNGNFLSSP